LFGGGRGGGREKGGCGGGGGGGGSPVCLYGVAKLGMKLLRYMCVHTYIHHTYIHNTYTHTHMPFALHSITVRHTGQSPFMTSLNVLPLGLQYSRHHREAGRRTGQTLSATDVVALSCGCTAADYGARQISSSTTDLQSP